VPDNEDSRMIPTGEKVMGRVHRPHKFCPYCGHRNEATADACENCGKDISWMRIPEHTPYPETPPTKPRSMPKQREPFRLRTVMIIILIILFVAALIALVVSVSRKSGNAASQALALGLCATGLLVPGVTSLGRDTGSRPRASGSKAGRRSPPSGAP